MLVKEDFEFMLEKLQLQKIKYESMLGQEVYLAGSSIGRTEEVIRQQIKKESEMSDPEILKFLDQIDIEIKQVKDELTKYNQDNISNYKETTAI